MTIDTGNTLYCAGLQIPDVEVAATAGGKDAIATGVDEAGLERSTVDVKGGGEGVVFAVGYDRCGL